MRNGLVLLEIAVDLRLTGAVEDHAALADGLPHAVQQQMADAALHIQNMIIAPPVQALAAPVIGGYKLDAAAVDL